MADIVGTTDTAARPHRFTWHTTGRELLAGQLAAIAAARDSVRMEVFKYADSPIGEQFRTELTAAARRGVKVWLLVDAFGSFSLRRDFFAELVAAGGAMQWFNPLRWASVWFRDHRKLLVIDGTVSFIGGCNIAPEYDGDGVSDGWRDGGVGVTGPVAGVLAAEFDRQWERATRRQWRFRPGGRQQPVTQPGSQPVTALIIKPGFGRNPLRDALRRDLKQARDVAITSAYFLPSHRLRRRLAQAVAGGTRVRLLLAGLTDVRLMQWASRSLYSWLLRRGIAIWEYQPQVLHAKSIVMDDIVYIGSSNLDPRSLRINFEIMLRIQDATLAAEVRRQFEADLAQRALPITRESLMHGRSRWLRFRQRLAYWLFARLDAELAAVRLQQWRGRRDHWKRRFRRRRHGSGGPGLR